MEDKRYTLFSCGTEQMDWEERNCECCVKGSHYNEKSDTYTKYKCAIQRHIHEAYFGDGKGNKRDHEATSSYSCPFIVTQRKHYPKKQKKQLEYPEITFENSPQEIEI